MTRLGGVAAVVIANAAVQALLVIGDPTPGATAWFVLAAVASALALVAAVWLLVRVVGGTPSVLRVLVVGTSAVAASLLSPVAVPVVLMLGAPWLVGVPMRIRGVGNAVLGAVEVLFLALLTWLLAVVLGFFVGGPASALLTWLWGGAAAALVLWRWARLR